MSHPFDATTKHLVEGRPADWVPLSGRPADGPVTVLDAELSTVTAAADKVLRVAGPAPWLLHLEQHTCRDPELPSRLNMYGGILEHRHGLNVWHVLVLLRREADHAGLTGLLERRFGTEGPYRTLRSQVVRVWELPAARLLEGGPGVLPLAPLTDEAAAAPEAALRRIGARLDAEASAADAGSLWTATKVLMGLRYEAAVAERLLEGVRNMRESVTYQAFVDEGRVADARQILLLLGGQKFGPADERTITRVNSLADVGLLHRLVSRVLQASSWSELLAEN